MAGGTEDAGGPLERHGSLQSSEGLRGSVPRWLPGSVNRAAVKDTFHDIVKMALQKDGWTITHDPLHIRLSGVIDMYVDLGASTITEFHLALGQFMNYRYALEDTEPDRMLYLEPIPVGISMIS
jgi:hypothetical protein